MFIKVEGVPSFVLMLKMEWNEELWVYTRNFNKLFSLNSYLESIRKLFAHLQRNNKFSKSDKYNRILQDWEHTQG